jgi:roadblock/LC7 domain-containing protein
VSEFDALVSRKGVLVAGRFGPNWRVAEHKSTSLFIEIPQVFEMMSFFCATIQMMLNTMALAMTQVSPVPETWQPVNGWGASIGQYSFALHGDRFVIGQTEYLGSIDEMLDLLRREET